MMLELDSRDQTLPAVREGWGVLILPRSIMYGLTIRYPVPKCASESRGGRRGKGGSIITHTAGTSPGVSDSLWRGR